MTRAWDTGRFTPWARNALLAAGYTPEDIDAMEPPGWEMGGYAKTSRGPWTFRLRQPATHREIAVVAFTVADVRPAIKRLTGENALEEQLRASLEALG